MSKTLEQFEQYLDKMKKYEHINTLLYWDMRTCAPKLGQTGHIRSEEHTSELQSH